MRRVAVVGLPGAGESTFARRLGAATGLPVIHLDAHHFDQGWTPKPPEEWEPLYADLVAREEWVTLRSRADVRRFLESVRT